MRADFSRTFFIRRKMLRVYWLVRLLTIYVHVLVSLSQNVQAFGHLEAGRKEKKNSNILEENIYNFEHFFFF